MKEHRVKTTVGVRKFTLNRKNDCQESKIS